MDLVIIPTITMLETIILIINSNTTIIHLNIITIVVLKSAAPKEKGGQYKIPGVLEFLIHTFAQLVRNFILFF